MSRILVICHNLPSLNVGATLPFYHACRYLSKDNEIFLFYFNRGEISSDILDYTCGSDFLQIPQHNTFLQQSSSVIRNMISYYAFKQPGDSFYNYYYYPQAAQKSILLSETNLSNLS